MGGAETMIMNVYKQIDKERIQFDFLVYCDEETPYTKLVREFGGRVIFLEKKYIRNPILYFFKLRKILKKFGPYKGLHAHMDSHNAFSLTVARLLRIPIRVSHSHTTLRNIPKGFSRKLYYAITGFLITHNASILLSCGESAGKALYGKKKFDIIYNPIDINSFISVDRYLVDVFKKQFNISQNKFVVGMVGRLHEVKNHLFALEMAKIMMDKKMDFLFLFAGEGPLRPVLEKKIRDYHLERFVILLGNRNDIAVFFKSIDILLMPSIYEGFPVTLIELQAAGVPALVSDSITNEVDLGFGLINRCAISESANIWIDKILKIKNVTNVSDSRRTQVLEEKGFDLKRNVMFFEKIYDIINHYDEYSIIRTRNSS